MRKWLKRLYRSKERLTKEKVKEMLNNYTNIILLDVRSYQEYEEGHLNGAINIPVYDLYREAPKTLMDKEVVIIAYCTVGVRSENAIKILKRMGYKNVYHLDGGIG